MCLATSNNLLLVLWDAPFFSPRTRDLLVSQKNEAKTLFSHPPFPFPGNFATATVVAFVLPRSCGFNFDCYTQREATPTQRSAWK